MRAVVVIAASTALRSSDGWRRTSRHRWWERDRAGFSECIHCGARGRYRRPSHARSVVWQRCDPPLHVPARRRHRRFTRFQFVPPPAPLVRADAVGS